jgi:hypothetical protein
MKIKEKISQEIDETYDSNGQLKYYYCDELNLNLTRGKIQFN